MRVNSATGEVTIELAGKEFRLHATMRRVADLQAQLGVNTFGAIHEKLLTLDIAALRQSLISLCTSGNENEVDDLPFGAVMQPAVDGIYATLSAGLPEESKGNGHATKAQREPRRGRDTEKLLSA